MLDFHSHILPGVDDGSRSVECSLQMLQSSLRQGVDTVVFTPHFYASENDPDTFLRRRAHALEKLQQALQNEQDFPRYLLGCEVHYYSGIGRSSAAERLTVQNTNVLLLEPPFGRWPSGLQDDLRNLQRQGLQVVIAHVERYITRWNAERVTDQLLDTGALLQCNAEFFIDRRTRRLALKLLAEEKVVALGSDSHNMDSRAPNLGEAAAVLQEELDTARWQDFAAQSYRLLGLRQV